MRNRNRFLAKYVGIPVLLATIFFGGKAVISNTTADDIAPTPQVVIIEDEEGIGGGASPEEEAVIEAGLAAEELEVAAPIEDEEEEFTESTIEQLPMICDAQVTGLIDDPDAPYLPVNLEEFPGYGSIVISMDKGMILPAGGTDLGDAVYTVKGAIVASEVSLDIITVNAHSRGLGYNDDNGRWNAHICLLPEGAKLLITMYDLQLENWAYNDEDREGENKPVGLYIDSASNPEFLWTPSEPIDLEAVYDALGIAAP